ncbi:MAG TPA: metal-dependent transcriptional regulator [Anaerolineae bacterium]|nr:metal-dependent transcriptional regulator [Anaerolineae bacterium]
MAHQFKPEERTQTESTEMYLITVYRLTRHASHASTKVIADMLGISPPSVSERLKRLAQQGYLIHEWREGAKLTPEGEHIAVNVLRKHRLIETFLVQMAGYGIDEVHDEACHIEHAISERLADRLEAMLGRPQFDPHGHPIPAKDGTLPAGTYQPLAEVEPGQTVLIRQVSDWNGEQLSYITSLGLAPGVTVTVVSHAPFDGPLTLDLDNRPVALARDIAQTIGVESP